VLGVDYAARFIDAAQKLQNGEKIGYRTCSGEQKIASMTENSKPDKAVFKQVFVCNKWHVFH
jgi:hypothetical protein